jgi:hypothetical protein
VRSDGSGERVCATAGALEIIATDNARACARRRCEASIIGGFFKQAVCQQ